MKRYARVVFLAAAVLLTATLLLGVYYYVVSDKYFEGSYSVPSSLISMTDHWEFTDNINNVPRETKLPEKLILDPGVNRVTLKNKLPAFESHEFILRFASICQTVKVYVDGQLRYEYGVLTDNLFDYLYLTATHVSKVDLRAEDQGKELKIVLKAPALFRSELGLVRDVRIGTARDFLEDDIINGSSSVFVSAVTIAVALVLLCMALIMFRMRQTFKMLTAMAVLAILWVIFFCSDSALLWNFMDYNPRYSAMNDWKFFNMDAFMPIASYSLFLSCSGLKLKKLGKWLIGTHLSLYTLALILNLTQILSINMFRLPFMVLSSGIYLYLFVHWRKQREAKQGWFASAVLVALAGYYLDYIKYAISLFPLSSEVIVFLQLKLSFMSFLGFTLIAYSILMIVGVAQLYNKQSRKAQQQADHYIMQMELSQVQYEKMKSNYETLRQIRHDMQHHFRILDGYLSQENPEETRNYLHSIMDKVENLNLSEWCGSHVANITLGWFENQAKIKNIRFDGEVDIPQETKTASEDLCAVLSNGLQNAIEACERVEEGERRIFLKAYPAGDAMVIRIENTFDGTLIREGERYQSIKKDPGHGIGLASISNVVKMRDGYMSVSSQENVFILEVVLNHVLD